MSRRRSDTRAVALAACALLVALGGLRTQAEAAGLAGLPLQVAKPRLQTLAADPRAAAAPIKLTDGLADWHGALANLAGTAHYDSGEWIYEDHLFSAYGAAPPGVAQAYGGLDSAGTLYAPLQRLPGGSEEAVGTVGAGPFADQADLWQLRIAVRGDRAYVLARTTTMKTPVRTGLLLLFDTGGGSGASHAVPFGSGLTTTTADVAALVTAAGTKVVDLASGKTTDAPAVADPSGYTNLLETSLPLAAVTSSSGRELRLLAATGLVAPDSFTFDPGGQEGPLKDVAPRFDEPVQSVYERKQALALAAKDIDAFFTSVSIDRLRSGVRERLLPGPGYNVRTFVAPESRSSEGGTNGIVRDYGLYVPKRLWARRAPATLLLRGSGMTAHGLAAITPGIVQQLGDDNGAFVVCPGGRSGFDLFSGAAYLDAVQALDDAERTVPIDRNRETVAGYSMGGYSTYVFAETMPDRFAGAFVVEGPVGGMQPATKTPIVNAFADALPLLSNVVQTPFAIYQGEHDANVPVSNGVSAAKRLEDLGLRYRLNLFPGDHFSPGIFNDYETGAQYLRGLRRQTRPAEVKLTRSMPFERAVDTGQFSDAPLAGHSVGLRFDHAWFVDHLTAADPQEGTASIDIRTLARPAPTVTEVPSVGIDRGTVGGAPPSLFRQQSWRLGTGIEQRRNALTATLAGASAVELDVAGMGLTVDRPMTSRVKSNSPVTISFRLPRPGCVTAAVDGAGKTVAYGDQLSVDVPVGAHELIVERCASRVSG